MDRIFGTEENTIVNESEQRQEVSFFEDKVDDETQEKQEIQQYVQDSLLILDAIDKEVTLSVNYQPNLRVPQNTEVEGYQGKSTVSMDFESTTRQTGEKSLPVNDKLKEISCIYDRI